MKIIVSIRRRYKFLQCIQMRSKLICIQCMQQALFIVFEWGWRKRIIEPEEIYLYRLLLPNQDQLKCEKKKKNANEVETSMSFAIIRTDFIIELHTDSSIKEKNSTSPFNAV